MTLEAERKQYSHDSIGINKYVDMVVTVLKDDADAVPAAYMAVDMIFRPFLQWMHSSQELGVEPDVVRNSTVHLVNIMLIELSNRVQIHVDGKTLNPAEWAEEVLGDIKSELLIDLAELEAKKRLQRATRQ
jgi:predicted HAD superfamily Cof-like phosphohydrolase